MAGVYSKITKKLDDHTVEVIRKSAASMIVKIMGMTVGLLVSIFLGRTLGADGLGVINLANRIGSLLLVFTVFGMNNVLVKFISIKREKGDFGAIANYMFSASVFNGTVALLFAVCGVFLVPILVTYLFKESELRIPLMLAVIMIIPQTYSRIFASGLIGYKKIWQSNLVEDTLSIWIVGFLLLIIHFTNIGINVEKVALAYAIGRLVVTFSIFIYWKKIRGYKKRERSFVLKPMIQMALPMLLVSTSGIIAANADIVMLGWLSDSRQVGLYSVAARLALMTSFFLQITNASVSPKLAALYSQGKNEEMQMMVNQVTKGLIVLAILSFLFFAFLGKYILLFWGSEFSSAYIILLILAAGQFVNISTGPAGYILTMCGKEKVHSKISIISVCVNVILNIVLISYYGAIGAAIATAFTVSMENVFKSILAKKLIGINTIKFN